MKFGYTIFYVADVRSSLAFYQKAFGIETRFLHESGEFGELETGSTALAFCSHRLMTSMGKKSQAPQVDAPCFEIAFTTEDVPAAVERAVAAGATLQRKPEQMPWGQTVAYVADQNSFLVEICTPVGC